MRFYLSAETHQLVKTKEYIFLWEKAILRVLKLREQSVLEVQEDSQ